MPGRRGLRQRPCAGEPPAPPTLPRASRKRAGERVRAVVDDHLALRAQRIQRRGQRDADRRIAGDDGNAADAARKTSRPPIALDEVVERFERAQLACDRGGQRGRGERYEEAVEREIDDRLV